MNKMLLSSLLIICLILFIQLISPEIIFPQDRTNTFLNLNDSLATDDSLMIPLTKSGYDDLVITGGANSVDAELISDDRHKNAWINFDYSSKLFKKYYNIKKELNDNYKLAVGTDYMFLNQYASFSYSDKQATSGIFRLFGTWNVLNTESGIHGSLILKLENRHIIGSGNTPRNLGYEAGSALSTASFKSFGWGLTNLYWKQLFSNKKYRVFIGIMDAGDWVDLFPLLNSYKYYMNEAFFNSPAMALPNQGLGITGMAQLTKNFYMAAGIHDANGEPTNYFFGNIKSFFNTNEFFTWIEAGYNPTGSIVAGETIHITYWHQAARKNAGIKESSGWSFSASKRLASKFNTFIRAGISNGDAALMHHLIMVGVGINTLGFDYFGIGFSWGGPNDRSKRDQYGVEVFYAMQLTQHINITPDVQLTFNPSMNTNKNFVGVYSAVRIRYGM